MIFISLPINPVSLRIIIALNILKSELAFKVSSIYIRQILTFILIFSLKSFFRTRMNRRAIEFKGILNLLIVLTIQIKKITFDTDIYSNTIPNVLDKKV